MCFDDNLISDAADNEQSLFIRKNTFMGPI